MQGVGIELIDCGQGLGSFPSGSVVKKIHLPVQEMWVWSLGREDPLQKEMATHSSVFLPVESCGQMSLARYSPWGRKESDTTEHLGTQGLGGTKMRGLHLKPLSCMTVCVGRWEYKGVWTFLFLALVIHSFIQQIVTEPLCCVKTLFWRSEVKVAQLGSTLATPWTIQTMEFSRPECWSE